MAKADDTKNVQEEKIEISKTEYDAIFKKLAALEKKVAAPTTSTAPVIISQPMTEQEATDKESAAKRKREQAAAEAWLNEKVAVKLFKDGKDYKDPLYISINGKNMYIQRGVYVEIPRKFQLLIDQSELQDVRAAEYAEEQATNYSKAVEARAL